MKALVLSLFAATVLSATSMDCPLVLVSAGVPVTPGCPVFGAEFFADPGSVWPVYFEDLASGGQHGYVDLAVSMQADSDGYDAAVSLAHSAGFTDYLFCADGPFLFNPEAYYDPAYGTTPGEEFALLVFPFSGAPYAVFDGPEKWSGAPRTPEPATFWTAGLAVVALGLMAKLARKG